MAKTGNKPTDRIALVLQGGGALGAYQVGVYEALQEHDITPNWLAGTSIGSINAAIIAGNEPENRIPCLEAFWKQLAHTDLWQSLAHGDTARRGASFLSSLRAIMLGERGFFTPRPFPMLSDRAEHASFYNTSPLGKTLTKLVDFDILNNGPIRLTVFAVHVARGEMVSFDSRAHPLRLEHIMTSGALPPGFPAVRVDGEAYWDGGVYSNTPLDAVLDDTPRQNTLCFAVNLWNRSSSEPTSLSQVFAREKEIRYISAFETHVKTYREKQRLRRSLRRVYERLPEADRNDPELKALVDRSCDKTMHIVHMNRAPQAWELTTKDVDFSWRVLRERWQQGYRDGRRICREAPWEACSDHPDGVVLHEVARDEDAIGD